jgi:hypothetical protein
LVKYVRLYGFDHRRTRGQFEVAWRELKEAVPLLKGSVVLGVFEEHLLLDGVPVETGQAERSFAQLLNAAGVASIQFSSDVTMDEFDNLVRVFALGGSKAQDFATLIKSAFPENKGNIRINSVKFIATDPANANVSAAAQIAAQSLSPEVKEWLSEPAKLVQLITAAEGAKDPGSGSGSGDGQVSVGSLESLAAQRPANDNPFPLSDKETLEALRLLTRFGELGSGPTPRPELIGLELHRSEEKIRKTVLGLLDELSNSQQPGDKPALMRAAEQLAIRYALERFQSGDLQINAVHQMLEDMGRQMDNLRKILSLQEEKMSKAGILVESHADMLDRMFWAGLSEQSKKKALLSEDAACIPARNLRQYVEVLLQRGDRETAAAVLENYASQVNSRDRDYRAKVANGLTQLADLLAMVGGNVLGETAQKVGDALINESNPEVESLLSV